MAAAHGLAGDLVQADATLARLHAQFAHRHISPYMLAIVATRCGRHAQALDLIERCMREHDPNAIFLADEPSFADLHGHPRWADASKASNPAPTRRANPARRNTRRAA